MREREKNHRKKNTVLRRGNPKETTVCDGVLIDIIDETSNLTIQNVHRRATKRKKAEDVQLSSAAFSRLLSVTSGQSARVHRH